MTASQPHNSTIIVATSVTPFKVDMIGHANCLSVASGVRIQNAQSILSHQHSCWSSNCQGSLSRQNSCWGPECSIIFPATTAVGVQDAQQSLLPRQLWGPGRFGLPFPPNQQALVAQQGLLCNCNVISSCQNSFTLQMWEVQKRVILLQPAG